MRKKMLLLFSGIILTAAFFTGCGEEAVPRPVNMQWGIPEEVGGFAGLEREPEGAAVSPINRDRLAVLWHPGENYILPISAVAEEALAGVRYRGSGLPSSLEVEWLDPREKKWYALNEIPEDRIRASIEEENDTFSIDFGPPQGADFDEGTIRVIWFRITPAEAGTFELEIFGFAPGEKKAPSSSRISNILTLQAEVKERDL